MAAGNLTVLFTGMMAACALLTLLSAGLAAYVNLKTGALLKDYVTKADLQSRMQECRALHTAMQPARKTAHA